MATDTTEDKLAEVTPQKLLDNIYEIADIIGDNSAEGSLRSASCVLAGACAYITFQGKMGALVREGKLSKDEAIALQVATNKLLFEEANILGNAVGALTAKQNEIFDKFMAETLQSKIAKAEGEGNGKET